MKKALSHDVGVCFIRQVGKRALFAKINNSDYELSGLLGSMKVPDSAAAGILSF